MKLLIASDEKTELVDTFISYLKELGHDVHLGGHLIDVSLKWKWAEIGLQTGELLINDNFDFAILFCWSGTGVSIAANKVHGVRAAFCNEAETARLARKWDDANALCLGLRYDDLENTKSIFDAFVSTEFDEEGLNQVREID